MQTENDKLTAPRRNPKQFEVTLLANPEDLQKLIGKDPMPSWLIGEKIAEAVRKGLLHIKLNLHDAFLQYNV